MNQGKIILDVILLGILFFLAVMDIRKKRICILYPAAGILGTLAYYAVAEKIFLRYFLGAFLFLLFFLFISKVTNGQIGSGDAFVFSMTGARFGWTGNLWIIYLSFVFAFFGAVLCIIWKKRGKKYEMPLVPYIFLAYLLCRLL